jgi:hypothetical protein
MPHQLDFINREHLLLALDNGDADNIPKDHQWNGYWIVHRRKFHPYKYTVAKASAFASSVITTTDFVSNESSRRYISSLGFNIQFREPVADQRPAFWIAASYCGSE